MVSPAFAAPGWSLVLREIEVARQDMLVASREAVARVIGRAPGHLPPHGAPT